MKNLMNIPEISWKDVDNKGRNALEYFAQTGKSYAFTELFALLPQEDFVEQSTIANWGVISFYEAYDEVTGYSESSVFQQLVERLIETVPEDRWEELLTHCIQTRLRSCSGGELMLLLNYNEEHGYIIRSIARKALLADYDVAKWRKVYASNRKTKFPDFDKPIPHLLSVPTSMDLYNLVIPWLQSELGHEAFNTWIRQVDKDGKNCYQFGRERHNLNHPTLESHVSCEEFPGSPRGRTEAQWDS